MRVAQSLEEHAARRRLRARQTPRRVSPAPIGLSERWQKAKPTSENVVGFLMSRGWMPFVAAFRDFSSHSIAWGPRHRREPVPRRATISSFSDAMQSASEPCGRSTGNPQDWQVGLGSVSRRPLRVAARRSSSMVRLSNAGLAGGNCLTSTVSAATQQKPCRVMVHSIVKSGEERSGFLR